MSHVVSSAVIVTDLDCLKAAVKKIKGLQWQEGQKTWAWYGRFLNDYAGADAAFKLGIDPEDYGKCEHAIRVDGSNYEIGVMKRKDGKGYSLVFDFFGSDGHKIQEVVGTGSEKLLVEYQKEFISRFANTEGLNLTMEESGDEITMELEVGT